MPSGSHGGSMGSHSSGGASFGGGRSSGGGYRNGHHRRGPRIFIIGRSRYYLPTVWNTRFSAIISFLPIALFFLIFAVIAIFSGATTKNDILVDYYYYQDMIAKAEANPEFIVEGEITDLFYNDDCGKWYYTYSFLDDEGFPVNGYTYSVYTREEIREFTIGQNIMLAVNMAKINQLTDSIPMDYKYIPIENDGEYAQAQTIHTIGIVCTAVCSVTIVGLAVALVLIFVKCKQPATGEAIDGEKTGGLRNCAYCGALLNESETRCKHCGAKTIK